MTEKRQTLTLKKPRKAESAPVPAEPPKSRKQRDRETLDRVFKVMGEYRVIAHAFPLKIDVHKDIQALPELKGIPKKTIRIFLHIHCHSKRYLQNLTRMGWRYDLSGKVACKVEPERTHKPKR
jgi:hypothetical protein